MRAQVAVLRTRSEMVLEDYDRLMRLAKYDHVLARDHVYHDWLWYPTIGRTRIRAFGETAWGRLFDGY